MIMTKIVLGGSDEQVVLDPLPSATSDRVVGSDSDRTSASAPRRSG